MMGKFQPCDSCALDKTKQRNMRKQPVKWSKVSAEKLLIDISTLSVNAHCRHYSKGFLNEEQICHH